MKKQVSVPEDFMELESLSGAEYCGQKGLLVYAGSRYDRDKKRNISRVILKNLNTGEEQVISAGGLSEGSPRFSHDGKKVAFLSDARDGRQIWVQDLETSTCRRMTSMRFGVMEFLWSPVEDRFAFLSVQPETFAPELLTVLPDAGEAAEYAKEQAKQPIVVEDFGYKADGAGFVKQMYVQLWVTEPLTKVGGPGEEEAPGAGSPGTEGILEAGSPCTERVPEAGSPSAEGILEAGSPCTERVPGAGSPSAEGVLEAGSPGAEGIPKADSLCAEGTLETAGPDAAATLSARCLTNGPWNHLHPAWSPDGKLLAFLSGRAHPKKDSMGMDLFTVSVSDGQIRQISEGDYAVSYPMPFRPIFTRDGKYVLAAYLNKEALADSADGKGYPLTRLHRVAVDGSENVDIFPEDPENCFEISSFPYFLGAGRSYDKAQLSSDGEHLLFISGWMGQTNLYRLNLFGEPKVELVAGGKQAFACLGSPQGGKMLTAIARPGEYGDYCLIDEKTGQVEQRLTESNRFLGDRDIVKAEEIWVDTLDGEGRVHGFVLPPQNREPGKKYPAVLYIHGGPHPYYTYGMEYEYQCLAGAGFAVIYCNPRGSSGYGAKHQNMQRAFDGSAYTDCLQIVEKAVQTFDWIDGERIGVTGGSYGGYLTNYMATHCSRFRAYVTQRSISNNLISYACSDMQGESMAYPNFEEFMVSELKESPVCYAERVNAPLLILHGTADMRTPVEGAHQFFVALKDTHKDLPVRMVLYPHVGHEIPEYMPQKLHYHHEMIEWFRKYL